jgi:anti-sigma regulatory factor (Ser/Thr protein kinase)
MAACYGVSVQSIYKQINVLHTKRIIAKMKDGRENFYVLLDTEEIQNDYINEKLNEDVVLKRDFSRLLEGIPKNAHAVFSYVFTEMLNNAIEHSDSNAIMVRVGKNTYAINCAIEDFGIGIFSKIQNAMGLEEKRYAVLELAKGKFTTEPDSHSGEGIFFSSKAADKFSILSDGLAFVGGKYNTEVLLKDHTQIKQSRGTLVEFSIILEREASIMDIFQKFTQHPDDYGFNKTIVPVELLEYHESNPIFVSRSQAKRLLARFERFENIILDFSGITEIGQGFADEIFRVFQTRYPGSLIMTTNTTPAVDAMIKHVKNTK